MLNNPIYTQYCKGYNFHHFESNFNETKSSIHDTKSIFIIKDKIQKFKYLNLKFKSQSLTSFDHNSILRENIQFIPVWNYNSHYNQSLYLKWNVWNETSLK